ncbi:MAG: uroporphyrinogen decarboxylase/cobalamine-independent methonine synthase family protein [Armatimonadota bacterium]
MENRRPPRSESVDRICGGDRKNRGHWRLSPIYRLLEEPEAVKELAGKVAQLLTAFLDEWFARYGREFIAHYPSYYMPNGITLSEDEVGIVNPAIFAEFFLPELAMLSARYGGLGMHCCANARHQWGQFLRIPGLRVLNLVQPPAVVTEAFRFFAPHVVQMHANCGEGEPLAAVKRLPAEARVILDLYAQTPDEALTLTHSMREAICSISPLPSE